MAIACHIQPLSEYGIQNIVKAIANSESLMHLEYAQYGVALNSIDADLLRQGLQTYQAKFSEDKLQEILIPAHARYVHSVYRTH